ncbi:MAG: serine/threonine protein kinase, partial [Polaromonas sp.]
RQAVPVVEKPAAARPVAAKPAAETAAVAAGSEAAGPAPAATNPKQACENRVLLGFQLCMNEQCAKPAFSKHPACVERRAMEKLRQEAQEMRN